MAVQVEEASVVKTALYDKPDPLGAHQKSQTRTTTTIKIAGTNEEMTLPCWSSTKCSDIAAVLEKDLGLQEGSLQFVSKQGAYMKPLYLSDEIGRKVFVKGIKSFKRPPFPRKDPTAIIGAGHLGLRTAMQFMKKKDFNFVVLDRHSTVGGTSWHDQANTTSKLQTEFGVYHLQYEEDHPLPDDFTTPWPSRDDLLKHFQTVAADYGIIPYCRMNTDVKSVENVMLTQLQRAHIPHWLHTDYFKLTLGDTGGNKDGALQDAPEEEFRAWNIVMYPGNLSVPRVEEYRGEEDFGGPVVYGIENNFDYNDVTGKDVMIVGHGAFAVENVRSCAEFSCGKIYLVCRRKNISLPRVSSWLANRSFVPVNAAIFVKSMEPMYNLIGVDPWDYYALKYNKEKTQCTIIQKARFGIGDFYFLASYYGKLEVIVEPVGPVKKLSHHMAHLGSGRKLEIQVILKLLGFWGKWDNDTLLGVKEMVGYWVNGDVRRYLWAEPISVQAQNFGGTSFSPGAIGTAIKAWHFTQYPMDIVPFWEANSLPRHGPEPEDGRPAYVIDARHSVTTEFTIAATFPKLESEVHPALKAIKQRLCHPVKKYIAEAKADWDSYCQRLQDEGYDKPWPEYPYNFDYVMGVIREHNRDSGEPPLPTDIEYEN